MVKDKHIISEINGFFHKNDCNKAINSIMTTIRHLNLRSSCIGFEKRHNCKLTCLQVLELLLVFPFFMIKNSFQYNHSGLSKLFSCQKDMFYRFMNQDNIDWRKLVYQVSLCLLNRISSRKDSKTSLQCLIVDDTDLQKTGLRTELIGRIYSHVLHRSVLGFKGLFLCHTDGKTQTMLDFSLHGEEGKNPEKSQGLTEKQRKARFSKERDEDSMTNTRVKEYRLSKIDRSIEMVKEAIKKGIRFDYLLVDSWFTCAGLLNFICSRHLKCHLIGMMKMGKTRYKTKFGNLNASDIVDRLKKEKSVKYSRKLNCIYAYVDAEYANRKIRIFFCKRGRKGAWNAFLSTNTELNFFEAYRIYSMRWAIEVCFAEMKGLLGLGKCQCRNFSAQIASVSLTMMQYNILSFIKRFEAYETIGGLFNQTVNGTIELSVTERIWDLILQIVTIIADLFSADEEDIIRMIANDNQKIAIIKELCTKKKTV
jgi:hypothetical protein